MHKYMTAIECTKNTEFLKCDMFLFEFSFVLIYLFIISLSFVSPFSSLVIHFKMFLFIQAFF